MIPIRAKLLTSFWSKSRGLIGKNDPEVIYFKTRYGIHTFGLRYPVDVLILDSNNRVIKLKQNLIPNKIFLWNPLYNKVLELPQGMIKKKSISLNSIIDLHATH